MMMVGVAALGVMMLVMAVVAWQSARTLGDMGARVRGLEANLCAEVEASRLADRWVAELEREIVILKALATRGAPSIGRVNGGIDG